MPPLRQRFESWLSDVPQVSAWEGVSPALVAHFPNSPTDPLRDIARSAAAQGATALSPQLLDTFLYVRNVNRSLFEAIEGRPFFKPKAWEKKDESGIPCGGGVISGARGEVIEKVAVNMSVVAGANYPNVESEHAGKPYTAAGVSLICHPHNPFAPIVHMNVRTISVGNPGEQKTWIGGGADLTPMVKFEEDTALFHKAFEEVCAQNRLGDYPRFKKWCDEYFFIKHRNEPRGVGGIFFDYLEVSSLADCKLLLDVGQTLARVYGEILARRAQTPFNESDKEQQLYWRGRYAEFNLLYDRGTRFGLLSGGNVDAIFSSLPPLVRW